MKQETMRLQKYMSMCGIASRRASEKLIEQGRMSVNGEIVRELGVKVDPEMDEVRFDGRLLQLERTVTIALNKPAGVVSTNHDPEGRKTIQALVEDIPVHLYHIGRLDYNTEGLLLMSNDGELANLLMHPRHGMKKTYLAVCKGKFSTKELEALRTGVMLEDGETNPAEVQVRKYDKGFSHIEIVISEGRNRQVRRMIEAVDHEISYLCRERIGNIALDDLKPGTWRTLKKNEIQKLKALAQGRIS